MVMARSTSNTSRITRRTTLDVERALHAERQKLVDRYFRDRAQYWKAIYEQQDLDAVVLQERHQRSVQWLRMLSLRRGAKVLDVGCGAGTMTLEMARLGHEVHAVDSVEAMVLLARESVAKAHVQHKIHVERGDVCSLKFPDRTFVSVTALGVLGWLSSPELAIREMNRVLEPGGYLLLSIGNSWSLQSIVNPSTNPLTGPVVRAMKRFLTARAVSSEMPAIRHQTCSRIDHMLRAGGFGKVCGATIGFGPLTLFRFKLFSDSFSRRLHGFLESLADRNLPIVRSSGAIYIVLAKKL
jgi:ubiquinone/menaquinone biosynthesis C-methylase UbiE